MEEGGRGPVTLSFLAMGVSGFYKREGEMRFGDPDISIIPLWTEKRIGKERSMLCVKRTGTLLDRRENIASKRASGK